ncbi:sensor histidine kinase [Luteimicrobium subarcticum]|uniref:histidine kinase n=1 Tax=Luteimicrobium subarcticum TaxID=620910 RepID=A0A2M8WUB0_9MICO|nr:sensor histidine kinase [Luteimicrobium subarcticum]PJI94479.1 phospho-acceptor domain-containing protein [Luteimicrobium subarcticum]
MSARSRWAAARPTVTLRRRIAWLLAGAAVVLAVVMIADGLALARLFTVQKQVTVELFNARRDADDRLLAMVDAETGVRGYVITGDPTLLEPYDDALASRDDTFDDVADSLADIAVDQDALHAAATRADALAQDWVTGYAAPLVEQVKTQGPDSVTSTQVEQGKEQFDEVRAASLAFSDELAQVRDRESRQLERWTNLALVALIAMGVAGVVAGTLVWVALRRWVITPVDELAADSRAVASGDLEHPVTAHGPGEIAALAADIEAMRRTLVAQVASTEAAHAQAMAANDRLVEQAEELSRSNRDLEQFAYVASHDLQEPLRKVASFTQLLQKRYGGQLDERADQYIEFAVDGAKRMQRLIHDLLGFSRVGRVGGEVTDVALDRALARTLDNLAELVEESGAQVVVDDLPTVRGEEPLLVQLLQNLVGNAIKFRAPDRAPVVRLSARRDGDRWEVDCRDNGIGIDPQYAERVFVIFQRLHPKDVYEGTGIGLALCKKIVEFHGGQIWIDPPDDGVGTRIRFTLPAASPAPVPSADPVLVPSLAPLAAPAARDLPDAPKTPSLEGDRS